MNNVLLLIETAAQVCSVALANNGEVISHKTEHDQKKSLEVINDLIEQMFSEVEFSFKDLKAVGISGGPGSYTGLRVGASCAKGICYALDIPLIQIDSLTSMIEGVKERYKKDKYEIYFPMIDARRMEVFCRAEDLNGSCILETNHQFLEHILLADFFSGKKVLFFGNGAFKVKNIIPNIETIFDEFIPSAIDLAQLAHQKFKDSSFQSTAYYEPKYLKEVFISSKRA